MPLTRKKKRPRDPSQLGKMIVDISVGEIEEPAETAKSIRARKAGKRGGPARAKRLTEEQRASIARAAAEARWKKTR